MFFMVLLLLPIHMDSGIHQVLGMPLKSMPTTMDSKTATSAHVPNLNSPPPTIGKCGKPIAKTPKEIACAKAYISKDYEKTCGSVPSPPKNVQANFLFNKTTRNLLLHIFWAEPDYGRSTLWGYEVNIIDHNAGSSNPICRQINSKKAEDRHFKTNVVFDKNYTIILASLPRYSDSLTHGEKVEIKTPSYCESLKKYGIKLPFFCHMVRNFSIATPCHNGTARVTWNTPNFTGEYDQIVVNLENQKKDPIHWDHITNLSQNYLILKKMKKGAEYIAEVWMRKKGRNDIDSVKSKLLVSCKEKPNKQPTQSGTNKTQRLILYLLAASSFVLLVIGSFSLFVCLRRKKQRRGSNRMLLGSTEFPNNSDDTAPTAMLLYCHGCERVKNFILLLASVLNANGVRVFLDLLESNLIADVGLAAYLERREEEADNVIILCTEDTETFPSECHSAFNFVLNIIRNKIMQKGKKSKYIPVYIDPKKKENPVVPAFLQTVCMELPSSLEKMIQRIHRIRPYELRKSVTIQAIENSIEIDDSTHSTLKSCASSILHSKHRECVSGLCSKGLKTDQISEENASLQSMSLSAVSEFVTSQLELYKCYEDDSSSFEFTVFEEDQSGMVKIDSRESVV